MISLKTIIVACIMILGVSSYAKDKNYDDTRIVLTYGEGKNYYDYNCSGFCDPRLNLVFPYEEVLSRAKGNAELNAEMECKNKGYFTATLINEHLCTSESPLLLKCFGTYLCE